ncbi:MAG TPA: SMP-30/gluconolactonase/LRE family protein [Opitutaceae bacterium]
MLRTAVGLAAALAGMAFSAAPLAAQSTYNFSILAGEGASLSNPSALFFNPLGAAVDSSGNVYIADAGDHTIKKISGGSVTVFAGISGQAGSDSGATAVSSAKFVYPSAVAVDGQNNVYVADMGDNTIREISGGTVTLLAGQPYVAGSANGTASAATFNGPLGIAVDSAGANVYVSDTNNSVIRKIAGGQVSTFAGMVGQTGSADGSGTSAQFNYPGGIVADTAGNVYVADFDNSTIRVITPAGQVSTLAGSAGQTGHVDAVGGAARFDHPAAVAVDASGNAYVADTSTQTIRKIVVSSQLVSTIGGTADTPGHGTSAFFYPQGIAATSSGTVYVADTGNHEVKSVSGGGGSVSLTAGALGTIGLADSGLLSSSFNYPYGIAAANGNVYVADSGNNVIRVIGSTGVSTLAGSGVAGSANGTGTAASFNNPSDVAVDSQGNVFVADTGNSLIRMITPSGVVSTVAGIAGTTGSNNGPDATATFNQPQGLAVDGSDNIYVADTGNSVIRMITHQTGMVSTYAGTVGQTGSANGSSGATFNRPTGVALDSSGDLYVADFSNNTIRQISGGYTSTVAGTAGVVGDKDAEGGGASFNQPYKVAVDSNGLIYVADTGNHAIRVINKSNSSSVTTVSGTNSRFYYPQGIAVDSNGTIYVADGDNQVIDSAPASVAVSSNSVLSNHTIPVGGSTTFTLGSYGSGSAIQWQVSTNSGGSWSDVGGATSSSLAISNATSQMNGYEYRATLNGTATSAGTLYVGNSRLINLSSQAEVSAGNTVTAGFFVGGSGTKNLVVRGIGPTLGQYISSPVLADPTLTLYNGASAQIAADLTGWGGASNIATAMSSVGAFSLPANSLDEVLLPSLTISGNTGFTAVIGSHSNGSGRVLAELYDMDTSGTPATRLINISTKAYVDNGTNILISGFVVTGSVPETLLIRGDGPALATYGVTNPIATPTITIYNSNNQVINTNTGWAGSNAVATAAAQVSAFSLPAGSADSAIVTSLAPGTYTVEVTGSGGAVGTTLLEVYEVQ